MTRASSGDQSSLTTFSLIIFALILVFIVLGWQVYSMYFRGPAQVTRFMEIMCRNAGRNSSVETKRVNLVERCSAVRISGNTSVHGLKYQDSTYFEGTTFTIVYSDTLELPGFPSITHTFHVGKDLVLIDE